MKDCTSKNHQQIKDKILTSGDYLKRVEFASKIFALLSEPARVKILLALMEGELCVYHICETTGAKQSATSQHLRKLKDGNIIKARKEGNQVLYSLSDEHIVDIIDIALQHSKC
jgi:ArsR family transcriptional regulator